MVARVPSAPIAAGYTSVRSVPTAVPDQFDRGEAVRKATAATISFVEQTAEQGDALRSVEAENQWRVATQKRVDELDVSAPDYMDQIQAIYEQETELASERAGFVTNKFSDQFKASLGQQSAAGTILAARQQREHISTMAVGQFEELSRGSQSKIRADPDGFELYEQELRNTGARALDAIGDPAKRAELERAHRTGNIQALVAGYADAGRLDEAGQVIETYGADLTTGQAEGLKDLVTQADNKLRRERGLELAKRTSAIAIGVLDATSIEQLNALRGTVDGMAAQGAFEGNEGEQVELVRAITGAKNRLLGEGSETADAIAIYNSGQGFDTPRQASKAWEAFSTSPAFKAASEDERITQTVRFVADGGIMPERVLNQIMRAERRGDPQNVAAMAMLRDRLEQEAPYADLRLPEDMPQVDMTRQYAAEMDVDYLTAAAHVQSLRVEKAELARREDTFKLEVAKEHDFAGDLVDAGVATSSDRVPATLLEEYRGMVSTRYRMTGDLDASVKAAQKRMAARSGVSAFGGSKGERPMRHPPERFLPGKAAGMAPEMQQTIIERDVDASLAAAGITGLGKDNELGLKPWVLVEDPETAKDIREGRPPSYTVSVLQMFGGQPVYAPVTALTKDGKSQVFRWRSPDAKAIAALPEAKEIDLRVPQQSRTIRRPLSPEGRDDALQAEENNPFLRARMSDPLR